MLAFVGVFFAAAALTICIATAVVVGLILVGFGAHGAADLIRIGWDWYRAAYDTMTAGAGGRGA